MTTCSTPGRCQFEVVYEQEPNDTTGRLLDVIEDSNSWPDASLIEATLNKYPVAAVCTKCGFSRAVSR